MKRPASLVLCAALLATVAAGCSQIRASSLWHNAANAPLEATPLARLAIEAAIDERPQAEREGATPKIKALLFLLAGVYYSERGNHVTNDSHLGGDVMAALGRLTRVYLRRSRVVSIAPASQAEYVLRTRVHHLVAARFSAQSILAVSSQNSSSASHTNAQVPMVANAIATFELVQRRGTQEAIVWRRTLSGMAQSAGLDAQVAQEAVGRMLVQLAGSLRVTLATVPAAVGHEPPHAALPAVAAGFELAEEPFIVQRVLPGRVTVELRTLLPSGREVARQEVALIGLPESGTDEWVLSRRTGEGGLMRAAEYRALVSRLARSFDLRRLDDARHYHFFGRKLSLSASRQ